MPEITNGAREMCMPGKQKWHLLLHFCLFSGVHVIHKLYNAARCATPGKCVHNFKKLAQTYKVG